MWFALIIPSGCERLSLQNQMRRMDQTVWLSLSVERKMGTARTTTSMAMPAPLHMERSSFRMFSVSVVRFNYGNSLNCQEYILTHQAQNVVQSC
jgi:hypothetical protein